MQMEIGQKQDFPRRLYAWALENKVFLILVLIGGIGFFGILGGVTLWHQAGEEKAAVARFDLIEKALAAKKAKDWAACSRHYEELYTLSKRSPFYRVFALHGIGTCQREAGEFETSAQTFERAAKEPGHADPSVSQAEAKKSLEMAAQPVPEKNEAKNKK